MANYSPEKDVVELNVAVIGVVLNGPAHDHHKVHNLHRSGDYLFDVWKSKS